MEEERKGTGEKLRKMGKPPENKGQYLHKLSKHTVGEGMHPSSTETDEMKAGGEQVPRHPARREHLTSCVSPPFSFLLVKYT